MAGPNIIPSLRYQDAPAAIDWLCKAFGFEPHLVVPGENGTIAHAQLVLDGGMIMLGSSGAHGGGYDELVKAPGEVGGIGTQSPYVVVEDADLHHARAVEAGAEVLLPVEDASYGGRGYTCRDVEGHVWTFGTYDPMAS